MNIITQHTRILNAKHKANCDLVAELFGIDPATIYGSNGVVPPYWPRTENTQLNNQIRKTIITLAWVNEHVDNHNKKKLDALTPEREEQLEHWLRKLIGHSDEISEQLTEIARNLKFLQNTRPKSARLKP